MKRNKLDGLLTRRLKVSRVKKIRKCRTLCNPALFRKKGLSCTTWERLYRLVRPLNVRPKKVRPKRLLLWKCRSRVPIRLYGARRPKSPRNLMVLGTPGRSLVSPFSRLAAWDDAVLILLDTLPRRIITAPPLLSWLFRLVNERTCPI